MRNNDAYEMPLPEGATPLRPETVDAPPARDDFETLKRTLLDEEGNVRETRPVSLDPCPRCKSVHETDKPPICVCVKCVKVGRIVWCGQCVRCAWQTFTDRFGEASADAMFPQYGQWRKGEVERLKREGEPWEK
jgi:hypothetical protein